jgi:hypothetical protein
MLIESYVMPKNKKPWLSPLWYSMSKFGGFVLKWEDIIKFAPSPSATFAEKQGRWIVVVILKILIEKKRYKFLNKIPKIFSISRGTGRVVVLRGK